MDKELLLNKVAIVTGAGDGIGAETCKLFAAHGAKLVLCDIKQEALDNLLPALKEINPDGSYLPMLVDVTNEVNIVSCVAKTKEAFGRIDILINLAGGYFKGHKSWEADIETFDRIISLNLRSAFLFCKAVIPQMIEQNYGKIVNTASLAALSGRFPDSGIYAAAKGGVISFTRHLAAEVGEFNIHVNCVAPGPTLTPRFLAVRSKEFQERFNQASALRRMSMPQDQAGGILFLASDLSSYVTAHTLNITGGIYES